MILLDTHIWLWWVADLDRLTKRQQTLIRSHSDTGLGVSIISCWEIAKKCEIGKLDLSLPIAEWLDLALRFPGIRLLPLSPAIIVESTNLPGGLHRDPADQLIVATARMHEYPLLTIDDRLLRYPHVETLQ